MTAGTPAPDPRRHVILGTAGHIDHGKTSLVRRLTGIDTDRLPEERSRGISIDLGFAHFQSADVVFHVVDVPGHERFVRNMAAGATGIDLALLVVAADDGVMPQTVEHLEIMDLLGISAGVVAITKIDLVDPELLELVRLDVASQVAGTFLEHAPVCLVSSASGAGFELLIEQLVQVARAHQGRHSSRLFRMPIDRVFSVAGHGTVVTGSVLSGTVQPGETLELLPTCQPVRIRGVQQHGRAIDQSGPGRRCAINLAATRTEDLRRGLELATPGYLRPATRFLVSLNCLASAPGPMKDRMTLRLHWGADEATVRVIVKGNPIPPGGKGYAELRLERPAVASWGQPFILRRLSPPRTLGGGRILDPGIPSRRRVTDLAAAAAPRDSAEPLERLATYFAERELVDSDPLAAAWSVGIAPDELPSLVELLRRRGDLTPLSPGGPLIHQLRLESLAGSMLARMRAEIVRRQPRRSLPRATLLACCQRLAAAELLEAGWRRLLATRRLSAVGENFGPSDLQVQLSKAQLALQQAVLERVGQAGLTPPTDTELIAELQARPEALQGILTVCQEEELLIYVGAGLYYPPRTLEAARLTALARLAQGPATVSQLREAWGVSRKYGIPLCEYLDSRGVTERDGDLRRARSAG